MSSIRPTNIFYGFSPVIEKVSLINVYICIKHTHTHIFIYEMYIFPVFVFNGSKIIISKIVALKSMAVITTNRMRFVYDFRPSELLFPELLLQPNRASIHLEVRRLTDKSREVSKSQDGTLWWSYPSEIWQASPQRCYRGVRQISDRLKKSNRSKIWQTPRISRLRDLTRSCRKTSEPYWLEALV